MRQAASEYGRIYLVGTMFCGRSADPWVSGFASSGYHTGHSSSFRDVTTNMMERLEMSVDDLLEYALNIPLAVKT